MKWIVIFWLAGSPALTTPHVFSTQQACERAASRVASQYRRHMAGGGWACLPRSRVRGALPKEVQL